MERLQEIFLMAETAGMFELLDVEGKNEKKITRKTGFCCCVALFV